MLLIVAGWILACGAGSYLAAHYLGIPGALLVVGLGVVGGWFIGRELGRDFGRTR